MFAVLVDAAVAATSGPAQAPAAGAIEDYVVPAIEFEWLRARLLPHLIDVCKNVEIAVGRRLPILRTTVAAKLTRDAALNALKVSGASAMIDNVPVVGAFLGAFVSAGDMMAITGIQMMLMLQIRATFGKDPDVAQMWELLPIVGGGFGWRALARELSGFIPVGGILIKSAIAYAGTVVVGEGATFYELHGRHMALGRRGEGLRGRARSRTELRARHAGAHPRQQRLSVVTASGPSARAARRRRDDRTMRATWAAPVRRCAPRSPPTRAAPRPSCARETARSTRDPGSSDRRRRPAGAPSPIAGQ